MSVGGCHRPEIVEGSYLLGDLLARPDHDVRRPSVVERMVVGLLGFDEPVHAIQRHPAVVSDDPAAPVGVGQAGHEAGLARGQDLRRVRVEDSLVVGLAVLGEDLLDLRVHVVAVGREGVLHHLPATVGHHRAPQRGIRLEPDDDLVRPVDVSRGVAGDGAGDTGVDVKDSPGLLGRK